MHPSNSIQFNSIQFLFILLGQNIDIGYVFQIQGSQVISMLQQNTNEIHKTQYKYNS
jgi:hypothetical protein